MIAEITLSLSDFAVIGTMVGVVATAMLLILRVMVDRVEKVEVRVEDLQKRKTDKHEWAREMLNAREKLETLLTEMAKISGKIDAQFGIASSIDELVDVMKKSKGSEHGQ